MKEQVIFLIEDGKRQLFYISGTTCTNELFTIWGNRVSFDFLNIPLYIGFLFLTRNELQKFTHFLKLYQMAVSYSKKHLTPIKSLSCPADLTSETIMIPGPGSVFQYSSVSAVFDSVIRYRLLVSYSTSTMQCFIYAKCTCNISSYSNSMHEILSVTH